MARLEQFAIDDNKARAGVWLCYGADLWLRIARMGNPSYQERMSALQKPLMRGRRDARSIPNSMMRPLIDKAMSEHILLDWRNYDAEVDPLSVDEYEAMMSPPGAEPGQTITVSETCRDLRLETIIDETGELVTREIDNLPAKISERPWQPIVPYSVAEAEALLRNRSYQPIRDFVFTQSVTEETFRGEDLEDDSGN